MPRRCRFVLRHMRSYSSVLSQILGSHPQIDGYCETHLKYRTSFDLWRLKRRVVHLTGKPLAGDYVLDNLLHEYPIARGILASSRSRGIVIVRRPVASVCSIIEMGLTQTSIPWHRDFDRVARYYESRLAGLLRLTEALRGRVVFLEAERLFSNTQEVLDQLGIFLELQSPLRAQYQPLPPGGEPGSANPQTRPAVSLPRVLATRLQYAYDFWCAAIRNTCPVIGGAAKLRRFDQLPG